MAYRTHEPHLVPVLSAVRPNPELQDTHMLAPMAGQAAPRTGTPFGQVHTFHTVQESEHTCNLVNEDMRVHKMENDSVCVLV